MDIRSRALRRRGILALVLATIGAVGAAPAQAVVPEEAVGGPGSDWYSGGLIQQPGQNCSIVGSPSTEIMVSGIGSYGGTNGVVKVGDAYWAQLLLAVPGNPCGTGSSGIVTDLILPRATQIDTARPIRCFYLPRGSASTSDFVEVTGQTWSAFGGSGKICPATNETFPSSSTAGATNIGYRPLPSGGQLSIFVPVRTSIALQGLGTNDRFTWATHATGVYANPGVSQVFANVFAGAAGDSPFVYFARTPSAIPFWKPDAPTSPDQRNRAEFFANFYVAGRAGKITFTIRRTDTNGIVATDATQGSGFDGTVPAGQDLVQINATGSARGPNGGYVPFAYDAPGEWDVPMTITWTFTPTGGAPVSGTQAFRTLPGPDGDGDGVADARDGCPSTAGTQGDGCLPGAPPDPDGDGIYGAEDRCPQVAAPGRIDGCPPAGPGPAPDTGSPAPAAGPPPGTTSAGGTATAGPSGSPVAPAARPPRLTGGLRGIARNARLRGPALRKGVKVKVTCSRDATVRLTLDVDARTGRKLGLRGGRPVVARASGRCTRQRGATLTLKAGTTLAGRIGRQSRPVAATLRTALSATGSTPGGSRVAVRLG